MLKDGLDQLTWVAEVLVRANKLLLAVERSAVQEVAHTGKAIVIASM